MKTCLICGTEAPAEQATCLQDGEASWSAVTEPELLEAPVVDEPAKKRSRR